MHGKQLRQKWVNNVNSSTCYSYPNRLTMKRRRNDAPSRGGEVMTRIVTTGNEKKKTYIETPLGWTARDGQEQARPVSRFNEDHHHTTHRTTGRSKISVKAGVAERNLPLPPSAIFHSSPKPPPALAPPRSRNFSNYAWNPGSNSALDKDIVTCF